MSSEYEQLKAQGEEALKRKDFDAALDAFQKGLELEPDNPEALKNIGNVFLDQKQLDEAEKY